MLPLGPGPGPIGGPMGSHINRFETGYEILSVSQPLSGWVFVFFDTLRAPSLLIPLLLLFLLALHSIPHCIPFH